MTILNANGEDSGINGNGRVRAWMPLILWVASTVIAVVLAWSSMNARLDVLEVKYDRLYQDIAEIKSDVKTLLREAGR